MESALFDFTKDRETIQQARSGDAAAFEGLVHRYFGLVYGVGLAQLRDPDSAEDLAQEVFLRTYLSLASLRDGKALAAWLLQVTRNLATHWQARGQRKSELLPMVPFDQEKVTQVPDTRPATSPQFQLMQQQEQRQLQQAILDMPEALREVVLLHYSEGIQQNDIAAAFGVTPSTISRRLEKALAHLRRALTEDELRGAAAPLRSTRRAASVAAGIVLATAALSVSSRAALAQTIASSPAGTIAAPYLASAGAAPVFRAKLLSLISLKGSAAVVVVAAAVAAFGWTLTRSPYRVVQAATVANALPTASRPLATGSAAISPRASNAVAGESKPAPVQSVSKKLRTPISTSAAFSAANRASSPTLTSVAATSQSLSMAADGETNSPDPSFKGEAGVFVHGRVLLSSSGGAPVPGAKVSIWKSSYTRSGSEQFLVQELSCSPAGEYAATVEYFPYLLLLAQAPGSAVGFGSVVDNPGFNGSRTRGIRRAQRNIVLAPASHIRGKVRNQSGNPMADVLVSASPVEGAAWDCKSLSTRTGPDGSFSLEDVRPGAHPVHVEAAQLVAFSETVVAPAENVDLTVSEGGATIDGHIMNISSGEPVSGMVVRLDPVSPEATGKNLPHAVVQATDDEGAFHFEHVPSAPLVLSATGHGQRLVDRSGPDGTDGLLINLSDGESTSIVVRSRTGQPVAGRVTDAATGMPLDGVAVQIYDADAALAMNRVDAVTAADGSYQVSSVFPLLGNEGYVDFRKDGYYVEASNREYCRMGLRIPMGQPYSEIHKDVKMRRAKVISGRVLSEKGKPVAGAEIRPEGIGGSTSEKVVTGADGNFSLNLLSDTVDRGVLITTADGYALTLFSNLSCASGVCEPVTIVMKKGGSIRGQVVDEKEAPVSGAGVQASFPLTWQGGATRPGEDVGSAATSSDGTFLLSDLPAGGIDLKASKSGFADASPVSVELTQGESKDGVRLVLPQGHSISGRVTFADGQPVINAFVVARSSNVDEMANTSKSARTDKDGNYRVADLPGGMLAVSAGATDMETTSRKEVASDSEHVDFQLSPPHPPATYSFIGHVVDWQTGQPVKQLKITPTWAEVEIKPGPEDSGMFTVPKAQYDGGSLRFLIQAPGYAPLETGHVAPSKQPETLEQTWSMGPGGTVRGHVINSASQKGAPGAEIRISQKSTDSSSKLQDLQTSSDLEGRFEISGISAGKRTLLIKLKSVAAEQSREMQIQHAATVDLGDIAMDRTGSVEGRISGLPPDAPLAGIAVSLDQLNGGTKHETVTDDSGAFRFDGLADLNYWYHVPKYKVEGSVTITKASLEKVHMKFGTATLQGEVVGANSGTEITVRFGNANWYRRAVTGADGKFQMENLPPGQVSASASSFNRRGATSAQLQKGQATTVTLLLNSGTLRGKVIGVDGKPRPGITVSISKINPVSGLNSAFGATTQPDGSWQWTDTLPGLYAISASAENETRSKTARVEVRKDGSSDEVILRIGEPGGTIVSSVVTAAEGKPLPTAYCQVLPEGELLIVGYDKKRDSDGIMTIDNLSAGKYHVKVGGDGWSNVEHEVVIHAGDVVKLEDELVPAGTLKWILVDDEGSPAAGVHCVVQGKGDTSKLRREEDSDSEGKLEMSGLVPGAYTAVARTSGVKPVSMDFSIKANKTTALQATVTY